MPGKTMVGGTVYDVTPGGILIAGTFRNISYGKTMVGGTAYEIPFAKGTPISEYPVGSIVKMNVAGTARDWIIVHQGLPSSIYDDSCNGTWLLMKDIYEKRQWHRSNVNDYANSTIHSYLNSTFLAMFDSNIQNVIKQVKIPYVNGTGSSGSVASGANGLSAKIFLLSVYEVGSTVEIQPTQVLFVDGECLSYFSPPSHTDTRRIAYLNGTATHWWLRSPMKFSQSTGAYAGIARSKGDLSGARCTSSYGVRPALVLPSSLLVSDDLLIA